MRSPASRRVGPRTWVTTRSPAMVELGDRLETICYVDLDVIKVPSATVRETTKFAGLWRFDFEDGQTFFARDWDYVWLDIDQPRGCQCRTG